MVGFSNWCDSAAEDVGAYALELITARPADMAHGRAAVAAIVPEHYAAEEHVARVLRRLGRPKAAAFIEGKLPTTRQIRSGDLGEILATEYIAAGTQYAAPIKRLRWKDHRNMAMRGDDVIGLYRDPATGHLRFLKTEAKSRAILSGNVVTEARAGLDKDGGLPSAHALEFIADRLMEAGDNDLADAIDDALLKRGIAPQSVKHLLFTLSGNNPANLLRGNLQGYGGGFSQLYVGIRIDPHGAFIAGVYDQVIANANNG